MRIPFIFSDLEHDAHIPKRAHDTDAGYDVMSTERHEIVPHGRALVNCGIGIAIPEGYAGLILPRSGLALKKGLTVLNAPGLIDSGYHGWIKVLLWNSNDDGGVQTIGAGDRIAQLVIIKVESPTFERVSWLGHSERADGGFGSSGEGAGLPGEPAVPWHPELHDEQLIGLGDFDSGEAA